MFAASADIKEMQQKNLSGVYGGNFLCYWGKVADVRKPIIASVVHGYALRGGCEPMMCDIYADDKAIHQTDTVCA